ncbi:hypothetical protein HGB07_05795, partial [Candidatus Roizmanbacteria bacterium]|nr:hypothetical protein [Candidatus Roizmanbacteria bacterium]
MRQKPMARKLTLVVIPFRESDMAIDPSRPIIGFPQEWGAFFQRHPAWLDVHKNLHQVLEDLFIRVVKLESPAENLIFFIGRLCVEDFNETFLLAGNGYGFGSHKILRGLYERVVTMAYLAINQDEVPK